MRNFLLTSTVLAGALAASSAFAQTADQPISTAPAADSQQAAELGEIVVTGSRIRRAVSYTHLTLPTTPYV